MSTSVLTRRLIELREAVVIERAADGAYHLSPSGEELLAGLRRWEEWAERHAAAPTNGDAPAAG